MKRRRNLIILVLVLVLLGGSAYLITQKETVLGLDLRGGTELVYQARPTPQVPEVQAEDVDRAIEIIRERVDSLGVSEPEITRVGPDQIEVGLPDVSDSDRAIDRIGTTAQLFFYDWEGGPGEESNVIPPNPDLDNAEDRGYNRLIDAVARRLQARAGVLRGSVHHQRADLLPLRRRHPAAGRRSVRGAGRPLHPQRRRAAAEHRGARGPAGHRRRRGAADR